jgi:hypothetical protein
MDLIIDIMSDTRQVTEVRVWRLVMNPMVDRVEAGKIVVLSLERDSILKWYNNQMADEPYDEIGVREYTSERPATKNWHKTFKVGSSLEWFNPVDSFDRVNHYGHGLTDVWANEIEYHASLIIKI